ncbi:MAG: 4Fe-4S dicluster domain-containing protein [Thermodesulfobacteriota bacterium]
MGLPEPVVITEPDRVQDRNFHFFQEACVTCGTCASLCPASGVDGFDPRKVVRMVLMGMEARVMEARWPWICTLCGKCTHGCPMNIDIPALIRKLRSLRPRQDVPGILHKGVQAALETGNNLRLPAEDYLFILEDVASEITEEPGFENFNVHVDKKGANILTTIHNKLVNTHTEDLKHWWKIFHAAGEDWTVASKDWEGTSWGYFTGDDDAVRIMAGRIVDQMEQLQIKTLMWPE